MTNEESPQFRMFKLKLDLLCEGLKTDSILPEWVKFPSRVRTGASSGLDIVLPHDTYVNCPVNEKFVVNSRFSLKLSENKFFIEKNGTKIVDNVKVLPKPAYYSKTTSDNVPMKLVGQMCGDRLGIGVKSNCTFWESGDNCKFCSIMLNTKNELPSKSLNQIIEVAEAAINDPVLPAKHILISSGTLPGKDRGAVLFSKIIKNIKENFSISVYAMLCPPDDLKHVDLLYRSGLNEVGYNVEIFDQTIGSKLMPGKHKLIGRDRYIKALTHAVDLYDTTCVRSALLAGLEECSSTVKGVEMLSSLGIMPILACFRRLDGTALENAPLPKSKDYMKIYLGAEEKASEFGMPLGPICIPCQCNTIAFPSGNDRYKYY